MQLRKGYSFVETFYETKKPWQLHLAKIMELAYIYIYIYKDMMFSF